MAKNQERNERKKKLLLGVLAVLDLMLTGVCVVIALVTAEWFAAVAWVLVGCCQILWYVQERQIRFWEKNANDCLKIAEDACEFCRQTQEKYRAALRSLKESDEIMSILDKEDATIRYIRTKARMCGGCKNCVGCPLKEAGMNVSNEELNTEGCQHMRWCELYELLHPAEAAALVLKWEEEHAKG